MNIFSISLGFACAGRFTVLLTALSVYFWNADCIFTCHSGFISIAVTNALRASFGIFFIFLRSPCFAI